MIYFRIKHILVKTEFIYFMTKVAPIFFATSSPQRPSFWKMPNFDLTLVIAENLKKKSSSIGEYHSSDLEYAT